jgi:hypothetical protein
MLLLTETAFSQNTVDLTDLVDSGRNKNEEENSFIHEYELKGLAFRAERFVTSDSSLAHSLVTIFLCIHCLFFAYKYIM